MLATDSVSKYNTPLSLSLSLTHSLCVLHSQTHLAHPMFLVSEVTARIQICSTVINGLRVLQRKQISVLCVMIFNLHSMSHAVESVLLIHPITFHVTLLFYSQIHSVERNSFTYKCIRV